MKIKKINTKFNYKTNLKIIKVEVFLMITIMMISLVKSNKTANNDETTPQTSTFLIEAEHNVESSNIETPTPVPTEIVVNKVVTPTNTPTDAPTESKIIVDNLETINNTVDNSPISVPVGAITETEVTPIVEILEEQPEVVEEINKKAVSITFDDGPGPYTERLLDILKENNVKATFFICGYNIDRYADTLKRAYDEGHDIAIHSNTHESFTKMTIEDIQNEIDIVTQKLIDIGITPCNLVRPPYGNINADIKEGLNYSFILWSVDTNDWKSKNKDAVIEEIYAGINEGSIILMHDIHETTIDAVEEILPQLTDEYDFLTVDELFERNEQELEGHTSYRKVKVLKK